MFTGGVSEGLASIMTASCVMSKPSQPTLDKIEQNIGRKNLERLLQEHGIAEDLETLTQSQLRELSRYKDVDRLRNRLAEAGVSRGRQKGRSLLQRKVRQSPQADLLEAAKAPEIILC